MISQGLKCAKQPFIPSINDMTDVRFEMRGMKKIQVQTEAQSEAWKLYADLVKYIGMLLTGWMDSPPTHQMLQKFDIDLLSRHVSLSTLQPMLIMSQIHKMRCKPNAPR